MRHRRSPGTSASACRGTPKGPACSCVRCDHATVGSSTPARVHASLARRRRRRKPARWYQQIPTCSWAPVFPAPRLLCLPRPRALMYLVARRQSLAGSPQAHGLAAEPSPHCPLVFIIAARVLAQPSADVAREARVLLRSLDARARGAFIVQGDGDVLHRGSDNYTKTV